MIAAKLNGKIVIADKKMIGNKSIFVQHVGRSLFSNVGPLNYPILHIKRVVNAQAVKGKQRSIY